VRRRSAAFVVAATLTISAIVLHNGEKLTEENEEKEEELCQGRLRPKSLVRNNAV
jgi:hypothetical protein